MIACGWFVDWFMLFVVWLFGLVSVNVVGWDVVFCCVVLFGLDFL